MDNPTLTVIVPCYNVSAYIEKCVASLLKQRYKELDILLIDDGSTDQTPILCNRLCASDKRIRVIHQKNIGLSATREKGIKNTNHDFITFVDADDWIHPNMYQNMMAALLKEHVDIAQCGVCDAFDNGTYKHRYQNCYNNLYEKYNRIDSIFKLLEEKEWRSYTWNKIYRRNLFNNVIFPKGRGLDEDTSIMHQIFHNSKSCIYFKDEYYFYNHRTDSICNDKKSESIAKKTYDRANARLERYLFISQFPEYKKIMPYLKSMTISICIAALRNVVKFPSYFPKNYFNYLSSQILSIPISEKEVNPEWISKMKRIELFYLRLSPFFYKYTINFIYKYLK